MSSEKIVVFGAMWCGDCRRAKSFFDSFNVPYEWVDVDADPSAAQKVIEINRGMRSIPTIIFPDGSVLVEPSNLELARKLGIGASAGAYPVRP
ncbi:MAG: NrdH-redoxin [SAR202 cluster bacterium]|nr:NrdH-redoxin [SAR202 cluster bacterium]